MLYFPGAVRQLLLTGCIFLFCIVYANACDLMPTNPIVYCFTYDGAETTTQDTFYSKDKIDICNRPDTEVKDTGDFTSSPAPSDSSDGSSKHIEKIVEAWDIKLYPNPAVNTVQLELFRLPPGGYVLRVISLQGEVHIEEDLELNSAAKVYTDLKLNNLATGSYILQLHHRYDLFVALYPLTIIH